MVDLDPNKEAPAVVGSLVALLFTKTTIARKCAYFLAGYGIAKIFGPSAQNLVGGTAEAAYGLTALFGVAILEKLFDIIANLDTSKAAKDLIEALVKRIRG